MVWSAKRSINSVRRSGIQLELHPSRIIPLLRTALGVALRSINMSPLTG
jgi:hypothetical protein